MQIFGTGKEAKCNICKQFGTVHCALNQRHHLKVCPVVTHLDPLGRFFFRCIKLVRDQVTVGIFSHETNILYTQQNS